MNYTTLQVERHDAVTLVRLHRPDALNAINAAMVADLVAAFAAFEADPGQRCAILTGSERAFAAGADIKQMQEAGFGAMFALEPFMPLAALRAARKPWFAAVAGHALGGGCELALMADFILAADTARFGQPEITLGIVPGMGGTQRLARAIGQAKAMEMCLSGRTMKADEAERAGLAVRVVPAADLIGEALRVAAAIAAMPPLAAMAAKELVHAAAEMPLSSGLLLERRMFNGLCATADKAEGMAAFVEKRPPTWTGT